MRSFYQVDSIGAIIISDERVTGATSGQSEYCNIVYVVHDSCRFLLHERYYVEPGNKDTAATEIEHELTNKAKLYNIH